MTFPPQSPLPRSNRLWTHLFELLSASTTVHFIFTSSYTARTIVSFPVICYATLFLTLFYCHSKALQSPQGAQQKILFNIMEEVEGGGGGGGGEGGGYSLLSQLHIFKWKFGSRKASCESWAEQSWVKTRTTSVFLQLCIYLTYMCMPQHNIQPIFFFKSTHDYLFVSHCSGNWIPNKQSKNTHKNTGFVTNLAQQAPPPLLQVPDDNISASPGVTTISIL